MNILMILVIGLSIVLTQVGLLTESGSGMANLQVTTQRVPTPSLLPTLTPTPTVTPLRSVLIAIPFASQSPFGEWSDIRQQDGCEETAALMAVYWANGVSIPLESPTRIDKNWAKSEILSAFDYQVEHYGSGVDTSTKDTQERIIRGYFGFNNSEVVAVESVEQIVRILMSDRVVIVPTNGRLLFNPHFTNGGPERHNLVIKGYDLATRQFVTHDPGTRQGENYRYDEVVLFAAIRDYPTGDHEPIKDAVKRMIVVERVKR